jgi:hypothetical protein
MIDIYHGSPYNFLAQPHLSLMLIQHTSFQLKIYRGGPCDFEAKSELAQGR